MGSLNNSRINIYELKLIVSLISDLLNRQYGFTLLRYLITLKEWYYPLLWDLEKGKLKHKLYFEDSYASFVNVSSAAMVALTGEHQGGIRVWDVESGTVLRWLGKEQAVTISALHMSQNGRYAFTQDQKANTFGAYEVETGIRLATFTIDGTCSMVGSL